MSFEIYHQLGYRYKWNIESINNDMTGDGLIISPKHMSNTHIQQIVYPKEKAIFDPQFYLLNQLRGKQETYGFYPYCINESISTDRLLEADLHQVASQCLGYQEENNFNYLIIPSVLLGNNPDEYIEYQKKIFLNPFINVYSDSKSSKGLILQVCIPQNFIQDSSYANRLLNWITSINKIHGIYIIVETSSNSKQIENIDYLFELMKFINILSNLNEYFVILGYTNSEGLILSIANPDVITVGSFENTRRFIPSGFRTKLDEDKDNISPPTPRLYFSQLLQFIDYRYIDTIKSEFGVSYIDESPYLETMLDSGYSWYFTKKEPYMHNFLVYSKQLHELSKCDIFERFIQVRKLLEEALSNYEDLEKIIPFDKNSKGSHLNLWLTALNRYGRLMKWI